MQKAEPVGNHIGEMESVPDIVQLSDNKADIKEQEQGNGADFISDPHTLTEQVQHSQDNGKDTAIQVGQTFFKRGGNTAVGIAGNFCHSFKQTNPVVLSGHI